jgi:hypothetical protein
MAIGLAWKCAIRRVATDELDPEDRRVGFVFCARRGLDLLRDLVGGPMARRFATFILLGPFLVWLTFIILQLPDLIRKPDAPWGFFGMVLVIVMMIGFVPAFLVACADYAMARKRLSRAVRAAACAVLGYPAAVLGFWIATGQVGLRDSILGDVFSAGLFGVIPAAVCSWVAGRGNKAA